MADPEKTNQNASVPAAANGGTFHEGLKDGLPIGLGYLSVSFSFGILAVASGLSWWQACLVSLTNITSAGQVAGVGIMASSGGLIEMMVSQIVINLRYSLMAISLSQKTDKSMSTLKRALLSYGLTDEIFGVAVSKKHDVGSKYFFGLTVLPVIGWVLGTLLGSILGGIFPVFLTNALAVGIYGMFISIVIPKAKHSRMIMVCALIACAISCLLFYVPWLKAHISSGFAIIIAAVIAALVGVFCFPHDDEGGREAEA
jgi:4-azaleucine resistance transporter AzlC